MAREYISFTLAKDFFDWVEECDPSTFSRFQSWENKGKDIKEYYKYNEKYKTDPEFKKKLDSQTPSEKWVNDRFYAVYDRFYICEIEEIDGINQLVCKKVSARGTPQEQKERLDLFLEFQNNFNNIIRNYVPMDSKEIGYEKINGGSRMLKLYFGLSNVLSSLSVLSVRLWVSGMGCK